MDEHKAEQRYIKWMWPNLDVLPPEGKADYYPKNKMFRMHTAGEFHGQFIEAFRATKVKRKLSPFGQCVYCGQDPKNNAESDPLTRPC